MLVRIEYKCFHMSCKDISFADELYFSETQLFEYYLLEWGKILFKTDNFENTFDRANASTQLLLILYTAVAVK